MSSKTWLVLEGAQFWVMDQVLESERSYHARHTPHVRAGAPFGAKYNLRRAVLPRLDVIGEVVPNPACVTQVSNLDGNNAGVNLFFKRLC